VFKKIKNYHLFILIAIVFILNAILFRSINITKAQWQPPSGVPGEGTANIVTSPLSADLDLGGQSIVGEGNINANGTICDTNGCIGDNSFSGNLTVNNTIQSGSGSLEVSGGGSGMNFSIDTDGDSSDYFKWWSDNVEIMSLNESGNLNLEEGLSVAGGAISTSGDNSVTFLSNTADDTSYEWIGFYSGSSRKGIMIWDGDWDDCASNDGFCFKSEGGTQLRFKSESGNVRVLDGLEVDGDLTIGGNTWGSQSSWSGQTHSAYECPDGEYICGIDIDYYCYNCVDRLRLKCCSL